MFIVFLNGKKFWSLNQAPKSLAQGNNCPFGQIEVAF